jgi:hypothetical protein
MEWPNPTSASLFVFGSIIVLITKKLKKFEVFECRVECQTVWEDIKN